MDVATVQTLLSDTLHRLRDEVSGLAKLIHAKTAGNPFFIRQFIFALSRKGLLVQRDDRRGWHFDLARIEAEGITENVADLVIERILALPTETQRMVQTAACCDAEFEAEMLALAADKSPYEVAQLLEPAVRTDVVLPIGNMAPGERPKRYRFQHDRVQQAAQETLPPDRRSKMHARIGQLLLAKTPEAEIDTKLIQITDHVVVGKQHLNRRLRSVLRDLALAAARRTRQSNA